MLNSPMQFILVPLANISLAFIIQKNSDTLSFTFGIEVASVGALDATDCYRMFVDIFEAEVYCSEFWLKEPSMFISIGNLKNFTLGQSKSVIDCLGFDTFDLNKVFEALMTDSRCLVVIG